ncbi:MAG: 1-acyl-sn-glycerol-3-phosphate acyltransferase [Bacteroidales bacterium]|nr:1-acyl-sn-glycerol-3-phosphate acyltransferase [Bacteroidales bacterium]
MVDLSKFESIAPYNDEEAVEALGKIAENPLVTAVSQYFFPDKEPGFMKQLLKSVRSIDEFQILVMSKVVEWVLDNTAHNFSYKGVENLPVDRKFLALSNHRDIILDPAITQLVLYRNNVPMTEIAVGDNLLTNPFIEYLIRSNRMIKVIRGISARELYLSSQMLSEYIRLCITSGKSSIWLAQRQGRTKNGTDITEQGLLKMLDMSGQGDFLQNFKELNIIPMSISYEYEPCDVLKARELLISRTQKYVKSDGEDLNSILTGIKQQKGNIHLTIGRPLTEQEIADASLCDKNDRYQLIRHAVDIRVIKDYKLWNTNFIAYDILDGSGKYASRYTAEEVESFKAYMEKQLATVEPELNRDDLRDIFLHIYANPIYSKEELGNCEI